MTALDPVAVDRLLAAAGFGPARELVPLAGGANNRVYRVEAENGEAVLKSYFRHPGDPRDRLGAEWAFSRFAWEARLRCLPKPLASDADAGLALFEMVNGRKPAVDDMNADAVEQAADFVRDLNAARRHPLAARLGAASEACFSLAEHLGTVGRRVDRLASVTDLEAAAFVRRNLLPTWDVVRAGLIDDAGDMGLSLERTIEPPARCVSPSDFGFHNALVEVEPGKRVRFLDFEYAGWDDPAKLVCDFFCQPAVPVPPRYLESFARSVAECFPDARAVLARTRLLLPVYHVKWVCIRLNEFLPTGGRRREFSLPAHELAARRDRQLAAAREALAALQSSQGVTV